MQNPARDFSPAEFRMLLACIFVPYLGGNLFNQDAILATDYDKNRKLLILKRMMSSIIA